MAVLEEALIGAGSFVMVEHPDRGWEKLTDVTGIPAIGGSTERIETSTTSSLYKTYVAGMIDTGEMTVSTNFYPKEFARLKREIEGKYLQFAVWLGGTGANDNITPTGRYGKFSWYGTMTMSLEETEANGKINVKLNLINGTPFKWEEGTDSV